jgi:hypothetical protein
MNARELLTRRRLLGRAVLLAGGLISAPDFAMLTHGVSPDPALNSQTLSPSQNALIIALSETILPETDTPGAATARVDEFIAHILATWFSVAERTEFLAGLDLFASSCAALTGKSFGSMTQEERLAYLDPLDREAVAARARNVDPLPFFASMKELTLIGYYTSAVGSAAIGYLGPVGARTGGDGPISTAIWN